MFESCQCVCDMKCAECMNVFVCVCSCLWERFLFFLLPLLCFKRHSKEAKVNSEALPVQVCWGSLPVTIWKCMQPVRVLSKNLMSPFGWRAPSHTLE